MSLIFHPSGNKSGNRRTANIRSIGHSDLFSLSKEDLTDVLSEFPAAKRHLEEKGRQILIKMGMLEDSTEGGEVEAETVETKIKRMEDNVETLQTKLARLMVELESSNRKMQARVEQLEKQAAELDPRPPDVGQEEDGHEGRHEGVGGEAQWEREEAEGEEEELNAKLRRQGQNDDVAKEGDGESTKFTKDETERELEGDQPGLKDSDGPREKIEEEEERTRTRGDNRPRKGDGAEIEPGNRRGEKCEETESEKRREKAEEEQDDKDKKE